MRPLRLILALTSSTLFIILLVYIIPSVSSTVDPNTDASKGSGFGAYFSFHTPLFPPSAIISLTDDNSTFFLARPAAFGPGLPSDGLSGQLWIGSGFGEDALGRAGLSAGAEGELGCSDVPGWDATLGQAVVRNDPSHRGKTAMKTPKTQTSGVDTDAAVKGYTQSPTVKGSSNGHTDGTDDHLLSKTQTSKQMADHGDIQSIQESAEIAGKVVLLSRGGCGFLEKVMWVQRRGGSALIVGDDLVGGPLVTMYAKGDTSNVTIPALFTSHTTAHLLSSLVPPDGMPFFRLPTGRKSPDGKSSENKSAKQKAEKPAEGATRQAGSAPLFGGQSSSGSEGVGEAAKGAQGWFSSLLSAFGLIDSDSHHVTGRSTDNLRSAAAATDDFVIGVHDWRDADVVKPRTVADKSDKVTDTVKSGNIKTKQNLAQDLKGGIVTPGSGEYHVMGAQERAALQSTENSKSKKHGWFDSFRWTDDHITDDDLNPRVGDQGGDLNPHQDHHDDQPPHTGLWVTLRPTTMSASPFFDTLLVLVVSPLFTLTFVYALLLLRSRIRRRRWRAPKSVVERLPVRTYQAVSSDASSTATTPLEASVTTPLLQSAPRRVLSRASSRARSRAHTISDIPASSSASPNDHHMDHLSDESEKQETGLAAWRRKYGGKQKECVVCLEEYVDGVSQVMSLPCGHEFHVECITPWLTTRRRTCPICKGDVVRSLNANQSRSSARSAHRNTSASSSPSLSPVSTTSLRNRGARDSDDEFSTIIYSDDAQTQALLTRNDSPSAALPVPPANLDRDLERGPSRSRSRRPLVRQASDRSQYDRGERRSEGPLTVAGAWLSRNVFGGWNFVSSWSGRNGAPSSRNSRGRSRED